MKSFGENIRELREFKGLPLRIVTDFLAIDQAILSKIERGLRSAKRNQVVDLAKYFKLKQSDLLIAWLSDALVDEMENEKLALDALKVAEGRVTYLEKPKTTRVNTINSIKSILRRMDVFHLPGCLDPLPMAKRNRSDIDIMIEFNDDKKYSMFDLLDLAFLVVDKIKRKVDLVEIGYLKSFAEKTAADDLIKIYG